MYKLYRSATYLMSPFIPLVLNKRRKRGKEDANRMQERYGHPSLPRPQARLVWIHAASVGESNAAMPLIRKLLETYPALQLLITTGTVSSAELLKKRLPERAFHQYVPVDTPKAVKRFVRYWHPDIAMFIDSEFWPNLIMETAASGAAMGLVNARVSQASFLKWKKARSLSRAMLRKFRFCSAQSKNDAERLLALGMPQVTHTGNLKYDVPPPDCNMQELERLKQLIGTRPVWVAASTHPGEEELVAEAHKTLKKKFPNVLTIIVPRHSVRGDEVMQKLSGYSVARRSQRQQITEGTEIYLADTMGELGLFYRLAQVAFIGGSLVDHGGQNPLEAAMLSCPTVMGQYMFNFASIARHMEQAEACLRVTDHIMMGGAVGRLLENEALRARIVQAAHAHVKSRAGTLKVIMDLVQPHIS